MSLDEVITPEEQEEVERYVAEMNRILMQGTMVAANLVEFIDARMPDHGKA